MPTPTDPAAALALARAAREDVQRIAQGSRVIPNHMRPLVFEHVPALAAAVESLCAENARLRALGDALALEASTVIVAWGEGRTCGMIELSLAYRAWDAATAAATATEGDE